MDHLLDAALANANPGCKLEGAAPEGAAPLDQKHVVAKRNDKTQTHGTVETCDAAK